MGSWSRVGPWLPWMERGDAPGGLIYSAPFLKLGSVAELPVDLLAWMVEHYPEYLHPPANYTIPNMTSWRVFKAIIDSRRAAGEPDIQVPQQEKGEPRDPYLDTAVLAELASRGEVELGFEGTSYYVVEGETGQSLLWLEGALLLRVAEVEEGWELGLEMEGGYATTWPEKIPVSGGPWTNPEGTQVDVPGVVETLVFLVDASSCSTMATSAELWHYNILSCEVVLGQELVLLTLYSGSGPLGAGPGEVVGGVTWRRNFPTWLDMETKGYLVDRWLFKVPQM